MNDKKKNIIEAFLDHPYISAAVITLLLFVMRTVLSITMARTVLSSVSDWKLEAILFNFFTVLFLVILFIYSKRRKDYIVENAMKNQGGLSKNLGKIIILLLPVLIYDVAFAINKIVSNSFEWNTGWFIYAMSLCVSAGVVEEIMCRKIPMGNAMRNLKTRKQVITLVFVTSAVFGAMHMSNMLSGSTFVMAFGQSIHAAGVGCVFAAIFLRTGSILPGVFLHAFHDFITTYDSSSSVDAMDETQKEIGSVIDSNKETVLGVMIAMAVLWVIVALFMLRKKKWDDIKDNF